jgi:hypothetical protein
MKKHTKALACVMLSASLVTGCGNSDPKATSAEGSSSPSAETTTPAETTATETPVPSTVAEPTTAEATEAPTEATTEEPTEAPTTAPEPTAEKDADGNVIVNYGTPKIDGEIDDVWAIAGIVTPEIKSSPSVAASFTAKTLWDDHSLYTLALVTDPVLNKKSGNTYEQDSIEIFLDELYDRATSYGADDVQYRVNFDNEKSADHGDISRFTTATAPYKNAAGEVIGYIVESAIDFNETPQNDMVLGYELQVNDAGASGSRLGTINLFDSTGNAWSNPSVMGSIVLKGKVGGETSVTTRRLENLIATVEKTDLTVYVNPEVVTDEVTKAKALIGDETATQETIDAAVASIQEALTKLDDGSGFTAPSKLPLVSEIADPFVMLDGTKIESKEDWGKRAEEISNLYQYYMYGVWRDGSDEELTYTLDGNKLTMNITRKSTGAKATVTATVSIPKTEAPAGGYPVLVGMHAGISEETALANGIAVITMDGYNYPVASDNSEHKGAFYDLYPYGTSWKEQTGVLMAWSWGCSKVLDALYAGADSELSINKENTIITGVSRWGKAAAVCGAFEKRFKIVMPSCSGAGGLALFRYMSEGKTYDFSSKGAGSAVTYTANEPLGSLQSNDEKGWFNDNFGKFASAEALPFDQHMLASLVAEDGRYLFIIGSCISEDWVNAPSMWMNYLASSNIFDFLGLKDNIAINIHKEGHAVIAEDINYLAAFIKDRIYGEQTEGVDLNDLKTSVFALDVNKDPLADTFTEKWIH